MHELPIACTLGPAALKARCEGLLPDLWHRAADHEQHAEGFRLRFPAGSDVLVTIARPVDAERLCCRFLRFQMTVELIAFAVALTRVDSAFAGRAYAASRGTIRDAAIGSNAM